MLKSKKTVIFCLLAAVILLCAIVGVQYYMSNRNGIQSGNAKVFIYTYGGEKYAAEGMLKIIQRGEERETVMELNGNISRISDSEKMNVEGMKQEKNPAFLTVYMDENIYGFYGSQGFYREIKGEEYTIILNGFMEGYAENDK